MAPKEKKWVDKTQKIGQIGRTEDPYLPAAGQEASMCTECRALYQEKRWFFDEKMARRLAGSGEVREVLCPACQKMKDRYPEGYLYLSGDFFKEHKEEILTLVEKEAKRVAGRNVMDRIMGTASQERDSLMVETTTEKLAQHLGRAVHKAYKGELSFKWSDPSKFVRVYWKR